MTEAPALDASIVGVNEVAHNGPPPPRPGGALPDHGDWYYTRRLENTLPDTFFQEVTPDQRFQGIKLYQGRPVIGRDRPIDGGVYLVNGAGEACVVDSKKDAVLETYYQYFLANLKRQVESRGLRINQLALDAVYEEAMQKMPWSMNRVQALNKKLGVLDFSPEPKKISLAVYITNGAGVCRHEALYAGFLLERLKKDGHIMGNVSVDRNWVEGKGGHAWVRYTNRLGQIFILDPAQQFVGSLDEIDPRQHWFYKRPEDK